MGYCLGSEIKMNCDGAWDYGSSRAGIEVIIRDCSGLVVGGKLMSLQASSALQAEASAVLEDLILAKNQDVQNVCIQMDSESCRWSLVRRSSNAAADWLARQPKKELELDDWINNPPNLFGFRFVSAAAQSPSFTFTITGRWPGESEYYNCNLSGNADNFVCQFQPTCMIPVNMPINGCATFTTKYFNGSIRTATSKYILRVYCQSRVVVDTTDAFGKKIKQETFATVSEKFDFTLGNYFKQIEGAKHLTTSRKNRTTDDVGEVVRDIITGADHLFWECGKSHNMNSNQIYVIGNEVKFSGFDQLSQDQYSFQNTVLSGLRKLLGSNLTGELQHFSTLPYLCARGQFLFYREHPRISNARRRCALMTILHDQARIDGDHAGPEIQDLSKKSKYAWLLIRCDWKLRITSHILKGLDSYKNASSHTNAVADFAVFMRAACYHSYDNQHVHGQRISIEDLDYELHNAWEGFMVLWFDFCLQRAYWNLLGLL